MNVTGMKTSDLVSLLNGKIDKKQKLAYSISTIPSLGNSRDIESYYTKDTCYTKKFNNNIFEKASYTQQDIDNVFESSINTQFKPTDILCAGLVKVNSTNPDEFILKGSIYESVPLKQFNWNFFRYSGSGISYDKNHIEITIDTKTYLIKSVYRDTIISWRENGDIKQMGGKFNIEYDYSGDFEIILP